MSPFCLKFILIRDFYFINPTIFRCDEYSEKSRYSGMIEYTMPSLGLPL